jgi:hypothetical protein
MYLAVIESRPGKIGRPGDIMINVQGATGFWTPWVVANSIEDGTTYAVPLPRLSNFTRVSLALVNGELHICAVRASGELLHVSRTVTAPGATTTTYRTWLDVESVAGERGKFVNVACAGVRNPSTGTDDLHLVGNTEDGHVWHAVASGPAMTGTSGSPSSWTTLNDLENALGTELAYSDITDAGATSGVLNLVSLTGVGNGPFNLMHYVRFNSGSWSGGTDLIAGAPGAPPTFVSGRVAIARCQYGVQPAGRQHLAVALQAGNHVYFTVASSSVEDWDGNSSTTDTYLRPWEDLAVMSGFEPGDIVGVGVSERVFAP